ncbi:MAG: ankyrin repeat domain-containing protein [bacterium]
MKWSPIAIVGIIAAVATVVTVISLIGYYSYRSNAEDQLVDAVYRGDAVEADKILTQSRLNPDDVFDDRHFESSSVPMMDLAMMNKSESVQIRLILVLLKHGANVNNNSERSLPIYNAIHNGNYPVYRLLLEHGATMSPIDDFMASAVRGANMDILTDLVKRGASVNARSKNGETPLHIVPNPEVAEFLIARGADINAVDEKGNTPLQNVHDSFIADQLIVKGADVNTVNMVGDTPLHTAIWGYRNDVVILLLAYGADKSKVNKNGLTPLELAKRNSAHNIVKLLEE